MPKKTYFSLFLVTAFVFVPVYFTILASSFTGPCCYVAATAFWTLIHNPAAILFVACIDGPYLAVYGALFYAAAWSTYWLSAQLPGAAGRVIFQVLILLTLVSCSFLRVIHAASFMNDTGTYDFWDACARLLAPSAN